MKEAIWFKDLVDNMDLQEELISVYCDNQSIVNLIKKLDVPWEDQTYWCQNAFY